MSYKRIGFIEAVVFVVSLVLVLTWAAAGFADVKLPAVIGDNMVLQQKMDVPIWGWAEVGEKIVVTIGWQRSTAYDATADKDGKWMVKVRTPNAGGPYKIIIKANNTVNLKNVLVGEVWVCSGQSNMQWSVEQTADAEQEIAAANYPKMRLFAVERNASGQPLRDCVGSWSECGPETIGKFSAVSYFFGRELHKELAVPIGLVNTSWGGTRIEPWTPPVGFALVAKLGEILKEVGQADGEYRKSVAESLDSIEAWVQGSRKALAAKEPVPPAPALPKHPLSSRGRPTGLYNAMVHPLVPFGIRGAIWYQGESNLNDGMLYFEKMKALIGGWRSVWGQGDFPFYFVQLAPYHYGEEPLLLPRIWEAQKAALSVPNTGMAVTTDIGNLGDIHPKNKQDVGKRLALWALAKTYGRKDLVYSGPLYKSMSVEQSKVRIRFDHVGSGLSCGDGKALSWFTIAGADKVFVEAEAKIDGDTVVVWSDKVAKPVAVRFGWHQEAEPNLMNKEGLPASPFRTDSWPGVTVNKK